MNILLFLSFLVIGNGFGVQLNDEDGNRVHGGHYAYLGQFPWNAVVFDNVKSSFLCSASLISDNKLITSADCVVGYLSNPNDISVILGSTKSNPSTPTSYKITEILPHPKYNEGPTQKIELYHTYNIAILKSTVDIIMNNWTFPISLPRTEEAIEDGTPVQLSGWGGRGPSVYSDLTFAYMSTKNVYTCIQEIGGNPSIEYYYNLCTPGFQPETGSYSGACHYDHGGGLIIDYNTSPSLVGVVSFADCDSTLIRSTIYTSTIAHRDWITSNLP